MNGVYIRNLGHNDLAGRLMQVLLHAGLDAEYGKVLELVPLIRERIKTLNEVVDMVDFAFVDEITYDTALLVPKRLDPPTTLNALRATVETLTALDGFSEGGTGDEFAGAWRRTWSSRSVTCSGLFAWPPRARPWRRRCSVRCMCWAATRRSAACKRPFSAWRRQDRVFCHRPLFDISFRATLSVFCESVVCCIDNSRQPRQYSP